MIFKAGDIVKSKNSSYLMTVVAQYFDMDQVEVIHQNNNEISFYCSDDLEKVEVSFSEVSKPATPTGVKHDQNKPDMSLLSYIAFKKAIAAPKPSSAHIGGVIECIMAFSNGTNLSSDNTSNLTHAFNHTMALLEVELGGDFQPICGIYPRASLEVAKVMTYGKTKYSAHNWRGGFIWSRPLAAAARHLFAYIGGEDKDTETGLSHLAHCACCLMFLLEFEETHKSLDDRFKGIKKDVA